VKNPRTYGDPPYRVAVVHGGPGAPGEVAPVARELSSITGVLEPLQTEKSLGGQVDELADILEKHAGLPVVLVGWSWGAWLSFIAAARRPSLVGKLVLIGAGPFEAKYAGDIMPLRLTRMSDSQRVELLGLADLLNADVRAGEDAAFARLGEIITRADSFDPLPHRSEVLACQFDVYQGVWPEANEMRDSGRLLALGKQIMCPVVAIQGDYDPRPAAGVFEPLGRVLKDFKPILLKDCGHEPWIERAARDEFYRVLKEEITGWLT
jgi:pimeloyl-ACP methyl ester carboxylesterase